MPCMVFCFPKNKLEGNKMNDKRYLNANDVAEYMDISVPMAYKIIRKLNDELVSQGYLVVAGRVSRKYFEQKVYGGSCA
jgi:hypothetical protein